MPSKGPGAGNHGETLGQETLIALHAAVTGEISTLRDSEFRTALYSLGLDAAVIAVFSNEQVARAAGALERWGAIGLTSLVTAALIGHLFVLHSYLTTHRSIRRRIEGLLGVHEATALPDGVALFPATWKRPVSMRFQLLIFVLPIAATMALFQVATCVLIYHVTA